ncbi:hypothetical protein V6A50_001523 [Proteus mirabilis]|nr:hypothetical protein [Proteus mirabilis]MBG3005656.1 hypothetical protein [Proteus mirabilis]MBG3084374.1 hypothetical protein [Proteus mirabilis]MBG3087007.1 hypothetical protein [Proteus mirabilis]MBG5944951.1 hypothetical protein [Proteus mirabilis]
MNGLKLNKFFVFPILLVLSLMTTIILLMFPGDREYTKQNFVYYYLYTFDEVKKIDFISDEYIIIYRPIDGNSNESNDVIFFNIKPEKNIALIDNLSKNGFTSTYDDFYKEERWVKDNIHIKISIDEKSRTTSLFVEKS